MGFLNGFTEAFLPAYQRAGEKFQDQQNADRDYGLRKADQGIRQQEADRVQRTYNERRDRANQIRNGGGIPVPGEAPATPAVEAPPPATGEVATSYPVRSEGDPVPPLPTQNAAPPMAAAPRAPAAEPPVTTGAAGLPARPVATAPAPRSADDEEETDLRNLYADAVETGNITAAAALVDKRKEAKFNKGYNEYAKSIVKDMQSMSPKDYIAKYGGALNANGSIDGYMTFDEKTNRIAFSHKDGIDYLKPEDVMIQQLAAYKLGNGRVEEGAAMMQSTSAKVQARVDAALEEARKAVTTQANVHFAARKADNDDRETRAKERYYSAATGNANRADTSPIGMSKDGKRLLMLDKRSGKMTESLVPPGYEDLFARITGEKGAAPAKPLTVQEYSVALKNFTEINGGNAKLGKIALDEYLGRMDTGDMIGGLQADDAARQKAAGAPPKGGLPAPAPAPRVGLEFGLGAKGAPNAEVGGGNPLRGVLNGLMNPPSPTERFVPR